MSRQTAASRRWTVPFFGRTFSALFLLTFPEYDLSKSGAETISSLSRSGNGSNLAVDEGAMINGVFARNVAPGLGRGRIYEPKIYGFRVSEMARSGPRMRWLRDKPESIGELDEARHFAEQGGYSDDEDESMTLNGQAAVRRRPAGNARLRQQQREQQNGSPMAMEANGAESEL